MKQKLLILGIVLIIGMFLIGSVSATSVVGKGSKTVHEKYGVKNVYKWTAYKYSSSHVKQIITCKSYLNGHYMGTSTYTTTITKPSKYKVKVVDSSHYSNTGSTYKYTLYWYYKGSAYSFYKTKTFQTCYLKNYLI